MKVTLYMVWIGEYLVSRAVSMAVALDDLGLDMSCTCPLFAIIEDSYVVDPETAEYAV